MNLIFSFRTWRWLTCAVLVPVLWACNTRRLVAPPSDPHAVEQKQFVQAINRKLDVIFMIDNSKSMDDFQAVLARNLQSFMEPLETLPGGPPDLHLGIVSSSMGASRFGPNIPGCGPETLQSDDGAFQTAPRNPAGCARGALRSPEEKFIKANVAGNNFADPQSTVAEVFSCMAYLGATGCGFEHQLFAIQRALERADDPNDARNGGFLREDAYLAIVMLTNEDDCSAPSSNLFDDSQTKNSDMWGGLQTGYRCVEFGYLCNGQRPPRNITGPTPLGSCTSAEDKGELLSVKAMAEFVKQFKPDDPGKIFVAALLGPTDTTDPRGDVFAELEPMAVRTRDNTLEMQPRIGHSCTQPFTDPSGRTVTLFGDPGIRLAEFVREFGPQGLIRNVCDVDGYDESMSQIAQTLSKILGPQCINGNVGLKGDGTPNCRVTERKQTTEGNYSFQDLPFCGGAFPCWRFGDASQCTAQGGGRPFEICRDQDCNQMTRAPDSIDARVSCAVAIDD
jgi:hypothetical protein